MKTRAKILSAAFYGASMCLLVACGASTAQKETNMPIETEVSGPWSLVSDDSGMSFVTVKQGNIAEIGTFMSMDGTVLEDGAAEFIIVIDSLNTGNEIRDPRMRQFLFETDKYPYITVSAALDLDEFNDMGIGERRTKLLAFDLDLHGLNSAKEAYVMVTRIGANKVLVENKAPVLVEASDFELDAGIEKLRELAGLESITPTVPVTFSLVFERQ